MAGTARYVDPMNATLMATAHVARLGGDSTAGVSVISPLLQATEGGGHSPVLRSSASAPTSPKAAHVTVDDLMRE